MVSVVFLSHLVGGDDGIRTHDPLLAGQVLSQLSYTPRLFILGFCFCKILFSHHPIINVLIRAGGYLILRSKNFICEADFIRLRISLLRSKNFIAHEVCLVGPSGLEPPIIYLSLRFASGKAACAL